MLLGAHVSISGSISKAVDRAKELGCTTFQIFTRNPRGWQAKPLKKKEIEDFRSKFKENGFRVAVAHMPYLPNISSPDKMAHRRSTKSLIQELKRTGQLGLQYLVVHVGSHLGKGVAAGIKQAASAVNTAFSKVDNDVMLLLENMAGQKNSVGSRFENIRRIIDLIEEEDRVGVCLDTCHAFAAGYDFGTEEKYHRMWQQFDEILGRDRLVCIHMNDSKHPFNSKKDRHEHIGKGFLGIEPFRLIMQDSSLAEIPKILETPKKNDMDRVNLKLLWELAGETPPVEL